MKLHTPIKKLRLSKNLSQNYLADELGVDVTNYSRLERGETKISVERLKKIAEILNVNVSLLIEESDSDTNKELLNNELLKEILNEIKKISKKIDHEKE